MCPPTSSLKDAITFAENESSCFDLKRIISEVEIIGIGTPSSQADSIVHPVVLLAPTTPLIFSRSGSFLNAFAASSNSYPLITLDLLSESATCSRS